MSLSADLRYGLRQLRKNPGLTAVAVLTVALGIGATTAIFSVVYGVLLRPLPYPDSNRIMAIFEVTSKGRPSRVADPNFDDFRDQNRSFQAMAKYHDGIASVSGAAQPIRTAVAQVSPGFLKVFGIQPMLGRDFSAGDAKKGAGPTVLVSHDYWREHLGSPRDLSQSHLKIDGTVFSVVGVLPAGFRFPAEVNLWLPADLEGENPSRTSHNYSVVGRLRDGVTVGQADRDISAIARRIHDASSEKSDYLLKDGTVIALQSSITGKARSPLLVLLGAVGFLLLVACANVANLLLAQASVRGRELAIRSALGAARGRLIRQFLTEALLLSLWARSAAWRGWSGWRPTICHGWTASRSVFQYWRSRSSCRQRWPPASERSPLCARRRGTRARGSSKAGVRTPVRGAASASAGSSWRRRSRSRWFWWSEPDCSRAAS
jgi:predicted permease